MEGSGGTQGGRASCFETTITGDEIGTSRDWVVLPTLVPQLVYPTDKSQLSRRNRRISDLGLSMKIEEDAAGLWVKQQFGGSVMVPGPCPWYIRNYNIYSRRCRWTSLVQSAPRASVHRPSPRSNGPMRHGSDSDQSDLRVALASMPQPWWFTDEGRNSLPGTRIYARGLTSHWILDRPQIA